MANSYYATLDRNGTEDEITIYTPNGRPMLCVAFWDDRAIEEWIDLNVPPIEALR